MNSQNLPVVPVVLTACLLAGLAAGADTAPSSIEQRYAATARKLIAAALAGDDSTARLQYLCDRIGSRLSGSASLERAVEWSAAEMKKAGLINVQTPPVKVPHWVRGSEWATLEAPIPKPLVMIGLGMSVGTPPGGVTGDVIPVANLEQLATLGRDKVAGKIVLFTPLANSPTVEGGPSLAGALGALAVLIHTPHTRGIAYQDGKPKIPAASVSAEDALMMERLVKGGTPVRVHLVMEDSQGPDVDSHNVIGELRGSEKPEEVVIVGGHLDSWDIGQGAMDDGSGVMAALEAVQLIKKSGLHPRRTIRVLFFVNEENGGAGDRAYGAMIGDSVKNHVAAIVDDRGAEKPIGFGFGPKGQDERTPAFQRAVEIGALLRDIQAGRIAPGGGGGHIPSVTSHGVPGFGVQTVDIHYGSWNHSNADSFDKIVPREFQLHVAAIAVMSFVLADMPERLSELK
jgi:hypothetical protein